MLQNVNQYTSALCIRYQAELATKVANPPPQKTTQCVVDTYLILKQGDKMVITKEHAQLLFSHVLMQLSKTITGQLRCGLIQKLFRNEH